MCDTLARLTHIASFRRLRCRQLVALLLTSCSQFRFEAARGGGGKTEVLPVQKAAPGCGVY